MKHLAKLLIVSFLIFFSCSGEEDGMWETKEPPQETETKPVNIRFSRTSLETFAEQGITEVGIYVYLKDSLVFGKNLPLGDGSLEVDLPLGENLQTFAVANAGQMVDTDSLSKVIVRQDADMQKQIYLSDIVDFTSDNSVANLPLELKRLVGQAVFQPKETADELNAITLFDQLSITFTNVGLGYKVKTGECIQENFTVTVDKTVGFSASIYSLPTLNGQSRTAVNVVYLNGGLPINNTNSPLDTGIAIEASKRSVVYMPILDDAYLENNWTRSGGAQPVVQPFTLVESPF